MKKIIPILLVMALFALSCNNAGETETEPDSSLPDNTIVDSQPAAGDTGSYQRMQNRNTGDTVEY